MKSYNHLMEKFLSKENYYLGVKNATRHKGGKKRKYRKARNLRTLAEYLERFYLNQAKNYKNDKHTPKAIYDGIRRKKRYILVPTMRE